MAWGSKQGRKREASGKEGPCSESNWGEGTGGWPSESLWGEGAKGARAYAHGLDTPISDAAWPFRLGSHAFAASGSHAFAVWASRLLRAMECGLA